MLLKDYLSMIEMSAYKFSFICRLTAPVLYSVLANKRIRKRSAKIIYKKTKGLVDYKNVYTPKEPL